jgi:hypothetical protein
MPREKTIQWTEDLLVLHFGLVDIIDPSPTLKRWLDLTNQVLPETEDKQIDRYWLRLRRKGKSWNEEDLKMKFISHILDIAGYEEETVFNTYFEKEISAEIGNFTVRVEADYLIAKGVGEIVSNPYFCLHEYKRKKKYVGDPIGQMLAGMLIAQTKNNNGKPVYGVYLQGAYWHFAVLEGKEYCISEGYEVINREKLVQVILILRKLTHIIINELL